MEIINRVGKYLAPGRSWYNRNLNGVKFITVHHTADTFNGTDEEVMKKEMATHVKNGWAGLSYHIFIPKSGKIYQINDFKWLTYHDAINTDSIGVAVHGYFHPDKNEQPNAAQLKALRYVLDQLSTQHPEFPADQKGVLGHRERSSTACPGNNMIGYVTDYRNKVGKVDWGDYSTPIPPPPNADQYVSQAKSFIQSALNSTVTGSQQNDPNFKSKMAEVKSKAQQIMAML